MAVLWLSGVWILLYIDFSPPTKAQISRVRGRHYLPLRNQCLPLLALCSCLQGNLRQSQLGLTLKLHPLSKDHGPTRDGNLLQIGYRCVNIGFYACVNLFISRSKRLLIPDRDNIKVSWFISLSVYAVHWSNIIKTQFLFCIFPNADNESGTGNSFVFVNDTRKSAIKRSNGLELRLLVYFGGIYRINSLINCGMI